MAIGLNKAVDVTKQSDAFQEIVISGTTTFSPPYDCKAFVYVVGAGGAGGLATGSTVVTDTCAASGGGAGGLAVSFLSLSASTSYTAIIGQGGQPQTITGPNQSANGQNGGNCEFSGPGITTMTANGGSGGQGVTQTGSTIASATGGAGGTASGGNILNVTGGSGGDATDETFTGQRACAGGGGAVGLFGTGHRGGSAHMSGTSSGTNNCVAGGGGVGGRGGDATFTSVNKTATYGGRGTQQAADETNTQLQSFYEVFGGSGQPPSNSSMLQPSVAYGSEGSGTSGVLGTNASEARAFGGGGGCVGSSSQTSTSGGSQMGGGAGGAAVGNTASGGDAVSGEGGVGLIIIRLVEEF